MPATSTEQGSEHAAMRPTQGAAAAGTTEPRGRHHRDGQAPPRESVAGVWRWLAWQLPAWVLTAVLALAYVIAAPTSTDLAAASYRSHLFSVAGFTLWDNSWYAGHHLPAYSILAPALGAWLGPQLVAALSMVAATALFERLIDGLFARRATRIAALSFALGASIGLLANRVPFDLGLAVGMASLLAVRRERPLAGLALAFICSLASPVAGAFLALAYVAWGLARAKRGQLLATCAWPLALALGALVPIALLSIAFPEGGTQPFVASAFYPAIAGVLLLVLLIPRAAPDARPGKPAGERQAQDEPPAQAAASWQAHGAAGPAGAGRAEDQDEDEGQAQPASAARALDEGQAQPASEQQAQRVLRIGMLLYALVLLGAYAVPSAVGGNADRLGALMAAPLAACVLVGVRPRWMLLALAPLLLYWQANAPVADFLAGASDPADHSSYYTPLLGELQTLGVGYSGRPARIEVVPTRDHYEARYVAPAVPIARGWERQLDQGRNGLFYEGEGKPLAPARYRDWLSQQAISYVALPDAPLDYSAKAEAQLLEGAAAHGAHAYLREVWRSRHWRLYAVQGPRPLVQAPATLSALTLDSFSIQTPRAGDYTARVRFTPYWAISSGSGCVREAPGGWTEIEARRPGALQLTIEFSLSRVLQHGPRCIV